MVLFEGYGMFGYYLMTWYMWLLIDVRGACGYYLKDIVHLATI